MVNPILKVKTSGPGGKEVMNAVKKLTGACVLVGIPEKGQTRKSGAITNPQLAYIHTHGVRSWNMRMKMGVAMNKGALYSEALQMYLHAYGSPSWNIPPRPIIEPAIMAKGNREKIEAELKLAATAALAGKPREVEQALKRAGMVAQNLVKAWFTDSRNGWPPNSPATIKRKGSSRPLIDTGQLRNSITYVVEKPRI